MERTRPEQLAVATKQLVVRGDEVMRFGDPLRHPAYAVDPLLEFVERSVGPLR